MLKNSLGNDPMVAIYRMQQPKPTSHGERKKIKKYGHQSQSWSHIESQKCSVMIRVRHHAMERGSRGCCHY